MHLPIFLVFVALCYTAYAQTKLNFTALEGVFAKFPNCSSLCAAEQIVVAKCSPENLQDCLCSNNTIQYAVTSCVLATCSFQDQIKATSINQNELCMGYPRPSRSHAFVRAAIIIAVITFPIIILRFISRIFIARRLWWDDWFILVAVAGMIPNTVCPIYAAYHGYGVHFWNVNVADFPLLNILFYVCQLFYVIIQNAAKFSILFLYIRIFPTPKFRLVTQISIAFMVGHTVSFFMAVAFQCTPITSNWNKSITGHCVDQNAMAYAGACLSIFEDLFIMLLPIWVLKDLQMSLKKRISLCFMFAIGSFACVTSMMRLKYIVNFGKSVDMTWDEVPVILWSMIETYTAVICACLLTLRPLLITCFPVIFGSTKSNSQSDDNNKNNSPRSRNWSQRAADKLRNSSSGEQGERLSGDEVYLTHTPAGTMVSGVRGGVPESMEMSERAETPRSDLESVEPVGMEEMEGRGSKQTFNMRHNRTIDPNV